MRSGIVLVQAILAFLLHTIATFAFSVAGFTDNPRQSRRQRALRTSKSQNVPSNDRTAASPAFPLKASANNRYLVDQNNVPFLMVGDAPQTLIANLSQREAAAYMANRRSYGINTLWINLLCNYSDGCNKDATTFDGIAPFTSRGDLSTPNPAYFQRADEMINIAAQTALLSSWIPLKRAVGWVCCEPTALKRRLHTDNTWEAAIRISRISFGCMAMTFSHGTLRRMMH